jgi:hypothetical protein
MGISSCRDYPKERQFTVQIPAIREIQGGGMLYAVPRLAIFSRHGMEEIGSLPSSLVFGNIRRQDLASVLRNVNVIFNSNAAKAQHRIHPFPMDGVAITLPEI